VKDQTDSQLLCAYADHRSESAFAELVRRHVDFVHSAALRMVCDSHLAQDVAQGTFVALARNATQLTDRPVLSGWLHRTAQNIAAQTVRTDVRRRAREQEAAAMNELLTAEPDAAWEHVAPHLDAALGELNEADRDTLLLRYFERKSAKEIAHTLGTSEDAAQKRVSRAVERLREFLAKRGVTVGASGLVAVVSVNAIQAAPVGLAATIAANAALAAPTAAAITTATLTKIIAMTTLQKTAITITLAVVAGTAIYQARQASRLREENQTLQRQQAPLAGQLAELKAENEGLSNQVAQVKDSETLTKSQLSELLALRGKVGSAQTDSQELAKLKTTLSHQSSQIPDYFTNAMATGVSTAEKWKIKDAQARLARMKIMLNLSDDQAQAINDIMQKHIQSQSQMTLAMLSGKDTREQPQAMGGFPDNGEAEIKALFTPEQLAAYPQYQEAKQVTAANNSANSDASLIAGDFNLSKEQKEQIRAAFYQMNLDQSANGLNQEAISASKKSGDLAGVVNMSIELQKSQLDQKLKALGDILSPEQINTYREEQMNRINMLAAAMKMLPTQTPAGTAN
jgi:RNA polymerase sigma factor (sigma-70 family)